MNPPISSLWVHGGAEKKNKQQSILEIKKK